MNPQILTDHQRAALALIGKNAFLSRRFYLTGGTALAAFHLRHRYSEDLDFFSEEEVDPLGLQTFWKQAKGVLGFTSVEYQQSFNRNLFFLEFKGETLKTEFTYFPFPRIEKGVVRDGIEVDSALDIAVNKLFTIYQRTKARDYVDLYVLCREKGFTIRDLTARARIKFDTHIDPLQLGAQFVKVREARDYPRLIAKIEPREWEAFFIGEAKKLSPQILA